MTEARKILLLVEDSRDDADLIIGALEDSRLNAQIVLVRDGAEALDYLFERSPRFQGRALPHWILLDLKLPKVSGLEVLRQLRQSPEGAKIPVVVFTSSREEQDIVESYRWNVNSYLQKPIDSEEFERTVRKLDLYWSGMNNYPATWSKVSGSA